MKSMTGFTQTVGGAAMPCPAQDTPIRRGNEFEPLRDLHGERTAVEQGQRIFKKSEAA